MENKAFQYWSGLPSWAKGVVAVAGLGIGYFAVKSFIDKLKADAKSKDAKRTQQSQEDELQNNINNGILPTFQTSQYNQWADELQSQFDGCDFSPRLPVDPDAFGNVIGNWSASGAKLATIVLQFKNDSDYLALSTAWGASRTYDQCGYSIIGSGNFEGNLSAAVTDELAQTEINALNRYLESKHITYRF